MKPFFSVIIPTYNRAKFLRIALKSLALQTFKDFEAFIIDDGSTDETPEVFKEFNNEKNWNFIRFENNKRQAYCRNFAIKNSKGTYITFLDADDIWLPERLEKFAEKIKENTKAGFVFSNGYIMQNNIITGKFFDETRKIPKGKLEPYMAISDKWLPYVTTNVAFPKFVIEKTGFFREDMSHLEDMELYVKILKYFEVDYIPIPLSVYRIHSFSKNLQSLTLNWEKGLEDFEIALKTANPPINIKRELQDYVYRKQAIIFLKNSLNIKARKYLLKTHSRNTAFYLIYISTFVPSFFLDFLRLLYRFLRKIRFRIFKENNKEVKKFLESLRIEK